MEATPSKKTKLADEQQTALSRGSSQQQQQQQQADAAVAGQRLHNDVQREQKHAAAAAAGATDPDPREPLELLQRLGLGPPCGSACTRPQLHAAVHGGQHSTWGHPDSPCDSGMGASNSDALPEPEEQPSSSHPQQQQQQQHVEVFVGGLGPSTSEATLRAVLALHGLDAAAVSVKVQLTRAHGRCKGYAFVTFAERGLADEACRRIHEVDGCRVALHLARGRTAEQLELPPRNRLGPESPSAAAEGQESAAAGPSLASSSSSAAAHALESGGSSIARLLRLVRRCEDPQAAVAAAMVAAFGGKRAAPGTPPASGAFGGGGGGPAKRPAIGDPGGSSPVKASPIRGFDGLSMDDGPAASQDSESVGASAAAALSGCGGGGGGGIDGRDGADGPLAGAGAAAKRRAGAGAGSAAAAGQSPGGGVAALLDAYPETRRALDAFKDTPSAANATPLTVLNNLLSKMGLEVAFTEVADTPTGPFTVHARVATPAAAAAGTGSQTEGQEEQDGGLVASGNGRGRTKRDARQLAAAATLEVMLPRARASAAAAAAAAATAAQDSGGRRAGAAARAARKPGAAAAAAAAADAPGGDGGGGGGGQSSSTSSVSGFPSLTLVEPAERRQQQQRHARGAAAKRSLPPGGGGRPHAPPPVQQHPMRLLRPYPHGPSFARSAFRSGPPVSDPRYLQRYFHPEHRSQEYRPQRQYARYPDMYPGSRPDPRYVPEHGPYEGYHPGCPAVDGRWEPDCERYGQGGGPVAGDWGWAEELGVQPEDTVPPSAGGTPAHAAWVGEGRASHPHLSAWAQLQQQPGRGSFHGAGLPTAAPARPPAGRSGGGGDGGGSTHAWPHGVQVMRWGSPEGTFRPSGGLGPGIGPGVHASFSPGHERPPLRARPSLAAGPDEHGALPPHLRRSSADGTFRDRDRGDADYRDRGDTIIRDLSLRDVSPQGSQKRPFSSVEQQQGQQGQGPMVVQQAMALAGLQLHPGGSGGTGRGVGRGRGAVAGAGAGAARGRGTSAAARGAASAQPLQGGAGLPGNPWGMFGGAQWAALPDDLESEGSAAGMDTLPGDPWDEEQQQQSSHSGGNNGGGGGDPLLQLEQQLAQQRIDQPPSLRHAHAGQQHGQVQVGQPCQQQQQQQQAEHMANSHAAAQHSPGWQGYHAHGSFPIQHGYPSPPPQTGPSFVTAASPPSQQQQQQQQPPNPFLADPQISVQEVLAGVQRLLQGAGIKGSAGATAAPMDSAQQSDPAAGASEGLGLHQGLPAWGQQAAAAPGLPPSPSPPPSLGPSPFGATASLQMQPWGPSGGLLAPAGGPVLHSPGRW